MGVTKQGFAFVKGALEYFAEMRKNQHGVVSGKAMSGGSNIVLSHSDIFFVYELMTG